MTMGKAGKPFVRRAARRGAIPDGLHFLTSRLTIPALMISGTAHAIDAPVIYGRLNVSMEDTSAAQHLARLSNNRSVLGFRGAEDLGDGLKAIWQIEGSVALDTGAGALNNRDTRVGLSGPWGTLFAGLWTLPYTSATSSFDPFYPTTAGYMALIGNGSASDTDNVIDRSAFDRRQQNVVQYWTPSFGPISAKFAYSFGEAIVAATGAKPTLASVSAEYETRDLTIVGAYELHSHYQTDHSSDHAIKFGISCQLGPVKVAALVERLDYATELGRLTRNAWYVSGSWRLGAISLVGGFTKAGSGNGPQNARIGSIATGAATGADQLTLGAEYALAKRAVLYVYGGHIRNDVDGHYEFAINPIGVLKGGNGTVLATGVRYAF